MISHTNDSDANLRGLRRAWWILVLASSLSLALGVELLGRVWSPSDVLRWAALTAGVAAVQLVLLRRNLRQNHRPGDDTLLSGLGPANAITLARGLAIPALAGFLAAPLPLTGALAWAPAILFAASALPDFLDGAVARATNRVTVLGGILDMEYDCLANLAVSLLVVRLGKVPGWYISLGLARYLFVAGIWWRERRGLPVYDLTPSNTRRLAAGFQMAFFCVALWPIFGAPATAVAGTLFVDADPARLRPRLVDRQREGQPARPRLSPIRALARLGGPVASARASVDWRAGRGRIPAAGAEPGAACSDSRRRPEPSRSRWGSAHAWEPSVCSWRRTPPWRWSASSPTMPC